MKVYFDTLGCPKNFNDSDMAKAHLEASGHQISDNADDSDVIVVNTCGFIDDAKRESIDEIFTMAQYKESGKKLVVSGCLVQRYADSLYEEMPEVDAFIGVNDYEKLGDILNDMQTPGYTRYRLNNDCQTGPFRGQRRIPDDPHTAYLRIAEGCNNVCTYCIIPKIRGPYRSRTMEDILSEAELLGDAGCKELILIAQDTTGYGQDIYGELMLPKLLKELCKLDSIQWIRLMYCYDDKITDELIKVMAEEDKICKYIDIPLQHASDRVLSAMNRTSTMEGIRAKLAKLRDSIPDIHIRTTLIVGFPGETEEDHRILMDFVREQRFARLGAFAYSREEDTPAYGFPDQVDEAVKQRWLEEIMLEQMDISYQLNKEKTGKVFRVIVDGPSEEGGYEARTCYDAPEIDNCVLFTSHESHKAGDMVDVLITEAYDYDLIGKEVTHESTE